MAQSVSPRSHTTDSGRTSPERPSLVEALALLSLLSLFVRSDSFPRLLKIGSFEVGLQDALFLTLAVVALVNGPVRLPVRPLALLAVALVPIWVSALRSPVQPDALISVSKLIEFLVVGLLVTAVLRRSARPEWVTVTFAAGALANGLYGVARLLSTGGLDALLFMRTPMFIGTETAAIGAAAAIVWALVRLSHASSRFERRLVPVVAAGGVLTLLAAKSILSVSALPAVFLIALRLERRWLPHVGVVAACIVFAIAIGRAGDLVPLGRADTEVAGTTDVTRTAPPQVAPLAPPARAPEPVETASPEAATRRDQPRAPRRRPTVSDRPTARSRERSEATRTPPGSTGPIARRGAVPPDPRDDVGGSFVHRISVGYAGLEMFREGPWSGKGWLATSQAPALAAGPYDREQLERFPRLDPNLFLSWSPTNVHSAYIQLAAEGGIAALALFVLLIATAIMACVLRLASPEGRRDPWALCGLGWLSVMAVYLHGGVLFGGTLNAALIGAGLGAAGAVADAVRPRHMVAAVALGAALVIPAFVFISRGPPAIAAPTAAITVVDVARGGEVFDVAHRFARWDSAVLDNGLVRVDGKDGSVGITALDAAGRPTGRRLPLVAGAEVRPVTAKLVERSGKATAILFRFPSGISLTVAMVRGVAGVYLTPHGARASAAAVGVLLGPQPALFVRDRLQRFVGGYEDPHPWPVPAFGPAAAVVPEARLLITAMPFYSTTVRNNLRRGRLRGLFLAPPRRGPDTVFLGVGSVPGATSYGREPGVTLPGSYWALDRRGDRWKVDEERIEPGVPPTWTLDADAVLPLDVVDPAVMGVDEATRLGKGSRADALVTVCKPPVGEPPLCR